MRPHLHLLGILQLVWGAIGLLLGASMLLLAVGAIAIGVTSADDRMAAGRHRRCVRALWRRAPGWRRRQRVGGRRTAPRGVPRPHRHPRTWRVQSVRTAVRDRPQHLRLLGAAAQRNTRRVRQRQGLIRDARARTWKNVERPRPERRCGSLLQPWVGDRPRCSISPNRRTGS